jgi:predicted RNase H-like nuclease (RuvC/YqgF family)
MTSLREECEALRHKCSELDTELATVKTERDDYAATVDEFIKDHKRWQQKSTYSEKRDRIWQRWGVGKQSPQYKRVKAVLDQFVGEVQGGKN